MSLFPYEDILTKEIETWQGFADKLPSDHDRVIFTKLLNDCYEYAAAINNQAHPFPAESVIMALLLSQHKLISYLKSKNRLKTTKATISEAQGHWKNYHRKS